MKQLFLITFLFISSFILAQNKGTVTGIVTDKELDNEPLPFANVFIKGTTIGGTTDMDGKYTLAVPAGTHTIVFSFVGYQTVEKAITVTSSQTLTINQAMGANQGVALDEVEIKATTSKEKSSALLLEQKKATVIKESIGAEELAKKGVSDAAGAVAKISGVSKQEGSSNVYVRGLGDRYLNTTMNGLTLPSNDVNKKNIDLNLFPSDIIQNVSISKTYGANFYGDFSAGNVNITSKEYKGDGFFDAFISTGINSRAADKTFLKSEGTGHVGFYRRYEHNPYAVILSHGVDPEKGGQPINLGVGIVGGKSFDFKDDSRLSLFFTASFENNYEYRKGQALDFGTVINKIFPNAEEFEYSTLTTVMGNAYYKINQNNNIKYTSLFINSSKDQVGNYLTPVGGFRNAPNDESLFQRNIQFNQDLIFVNQLLGNHTLNDDWKLNWGVGLNNVFAHEPDRKRISVLNYENLLDNDPNTNAVFWNNNRFDNQRYFQKIRDVEFSNFITASNSISENIKLNFGYNARLKRRKFENIRYGYDMFSNPTITDINNLNSIINTQNLGTVFNTFVFRPINPSIGLNQTNLPGLLENTYTGDLSVIAGFVDAQITLNDKWTFIPGLRVENVNQKINWDAINLPPNENPGKREVKETLFLPSLNVKYALNDDQNLRFSFSKTVSFPEFKEMAPFVYEGVTQRIGGNPDVLGGNGGATYSDIFNIDLKYEWFMSRGELLALSVFGKQINNPINLVTANDATGTKRYFRTGDKARVLGVELEARKDLIKNEDEETILSANLNASYMHTEQDLKSSSGIYTTTLNRTDKLQGASPYLVNASINYSPLHFKNYKPTANLVFSYFSDRIDALGSGQLGNNIEKSVSTLDFVMKNKIGEKFEVNFSAKNILDPNITIVREMQNTTDLILSQYKRGINLNLQFKYNF
ncbi:TonB-dependent receptor [Tenacibaculum holothuriorum]|uniref:TonB-dependent receptor n=1 Tax=Tenacibaculum holothuriorum TaxID=1635173 RepID=A0A1Y2PE01_9FLAO|nr:TonB-dependent receptor [Tenacibaculum holothuriorum]OSY88724.1 TonB-dependent receptor [Tenacibaculum holothuriorum]